MDGRRARFLWDPPKGAERLQVEIRRGGWILGQIIWRGQCAEGQTPWLEDWSGAISGTEFSTYFATVDNAGQFGPRAELLFTPAPSVLDFGLAVENNGEQEWEDYGDGWKTDTGTPVGDPNLTNLQRHADGYLEFSGDTDATYATWNPTTSLTPIAATALRPVRVFVEAAVEAEQVHPRAWEHAQFGWGDPENTRWTWEGPAWLVGTQTQCQLWVEWRYTLDGSTWSGWTRFKPGLYEIVDLQFRLRVTRPDTDHQVKIHRFHTRARIMQRVAQDTTPEQAHSLQGWNP